MAVDYHLEPAADHHAVNLAPRLRPADAAELWAAQGLAPLEGLRVCLRRSWIARAAVLEGDTAALWGIIPVSILTGTGQPWLLTSDLVERHPRDFMREGRRQLAEFSAMFPILKNVMDARYQRAARWAFRLGFEVSPPFLFGPVGRMVPHRVIELRA